MNKEELLKVMNSWKLGDPRIELWPRTFSVPRPQHDLVTVITGVRRCGKSTVLGQLASQWKLSDSQCFTINFEDPRLVGHLSIKLLDTLLEVTDSTSDRFFFLDEVQNVDHWQKWLRLQTDRPKGNHFIVTGSNASLLSGELSTVLTGRHLSFELFPLAWSEYSGVFPHGTLTDFIERGGFPRALREQDPQRLLAQYFSDIVEKDIREKIKARTSKDLQRVYKMVFESIGSETSLRKIAGALDLSVDTVTSYLDAAENAYLCFCCPYFSYSERKSSHRNKKYYTVDTALRRAVVTPTGFDYGKDFESIVYLSLRRLFKRVYYWKGTKEVDFVVETKRGIRPIQVSWDGIKPRHEEALDEFYREFHQTLDPIFVTADSFENACLMFQNDLN